MEGALKQLFAMLSVILVSPPDEFIFLYKYQFEVPAVTLNVLSHDLI